ncbi:hypothetical protein [Dietzia sp. PP-33]|uniref:hypothetical protein n=1 Tax=Dietzia sp. PP-33 TaxID=2957500 RepID=UPI0029B6DEE3|nr:hypothetical protein [Dietzia sp. PP-33]MDX2358955.1 hypothetical protein [Dietzia sp. PP-33]
MSQLTARREVGELRSSRSPLRNWIRRDLGEGMTPPTSETSNGADRAPQGKRSAATGQRDPEDCFGVFRLGGARLQTRVLIDYIRTYQSRFGIEPVCAVLAEHGAQIAPSTFAARGFGPTDAELADAHAANELRRLWVANRCLYGRRNSGRQTVLRPAHGWHRDRIERLMKLAGIEGVRRGRRTTVRIQRHDTAARHPDHIRRRWAWPTRPDQWWVADM